MFYLDILCYVFLSDSDCRLGRFKSINNESLASLNTTLTSVRGCITVSSSRQVAGLQSCGEKTSRDSIHRLQSASETGEQLG